jgi:flagellar hook-basal body complex protein FliE
MAIVPIDPSMSMTGPEWSVGGVGGVGPVDGGAQGSSGGGFGGMLSNAISSLEQTQADAAKASQSLATGTATDPTQVVMAVERARLSMQMASQIRTKGVEAFQDLFHTQV